MRLTDRFEPSPVKQNRNGPEKKDENEPILPQQNRHESPRITSNQTEPNPAGQNRSQSNRTPTNHPTAHLGNFIEARVK